MYKRVRNLTAALLLLTLAVACMRVTGELNNASPSTAIAPSPTMSATGETMPSSSELPEPTLSNNSAVTEIHIIDEFVCGSEDGLLKLGMTQSDAIDALIVSEIDPEGNVGGHGMDYLDSRPRSAAEYGWISIEFFNDDDTIYLITVGGVFPTKAGLRAGDTFDRAVELYGDAYVFYFADGGLDDVYEYAMDGQYLRVLVDESGCVRRVGISLYSEEWLRSHDQ